MSAFSDTPSLVASAPVTPFRFVKITGRNTGANVGAITELAVGICDGSTSSFDQAVIVAGDTIPLQGGNVVLIESAGVIAAGAVVAPSANGRAQTAAATQFPYGVALEPAGAAGSIIRIYKQAGASVV